MSKPAKAKRTRTRSPGFIIMTWVSAVLSVGLMLLVGNGFKADIAGFRPCSVNNSGLTLSTCGRQGINIGDLVFFGLFVLSACLVVTLFTAGWRMSRGSTK